MQILSKLSFLRDAKSLNVIDEVMETLTELGKTAKEGGLYSRLSFLPWSIAKYRTPANKRVYLRLWGSPESLSSVAQAAVVATEARLKAEVPDTPVEVKRALAGTLVDLAISDSDMHEDIEESLISEDDEEAVILKSAMLAATADVSFRKVVQIIRASTSTQNPKNFIIKEITENSPRAVKFYSELEKLKLLSQLQSIAATQTMKPEFARVLAQEGDVNLRDLRSAYSLVMALVLREPGLQLIEYHRRRREVRDEFVTPAATYLELEELGKLGFVEKIGRRYCPKNRTKNSSLEDFSK